MTNGYLEVISLVERLHRNFLEVVKLELDGLGIHDINNVQGLMLFNIGDAEMTVGELTLRGCYPGSNASGSAPATSSSGRANSPPESALGPSSIPLLRFPRA